MTLPYPDDAADDSGEAQKVIHRYQQRAPAGQDPRYSVLEPDVYLARQERQRALIGYLRRHASAPLDELRVLEVGCGTGANLLELICLGFSPQYLAGNELLPQRVALARRNLPQACAVFEGDASALRFQDACFDIVYQSTVFTSLLDAGFQQRLADCMWSWVKPGGAILWYDFVYDNPANPDVRGVPLKRIRQLFPQGEIACRRVTLAPPISRRVCRIHPSVYSIFNAIPWLRTHVLCWIAKKQG